MWGRSKEAAAILAYLHAANSGDRATTAPISSISARAPGEGKAPRRCVRPISALRLVERKVEHDQAAVANLVAQLVRRDRGQHVALQQQAAQHREVAGLDRRHRRRLPRLREEALQQLARRRARAARAPSVAWRSASKSMRAARASGWPARAITEMRSSNSASCCRSFASSALRSAPRMKSMSPLRSDAASASYGLSTVATCSRGWRASSEAIASGRICVRPERQRADVHAALQRAFAGRDVRADVAQLGQHALEVEGDDLAGRRRRQPARACDRRARRRARLPDPSARC